MGKNVDRLYFYNYRRKQVYGKTIQQRRITIRLQLYKSRNMCNVTIFGNRILVEFKAFYKHY